MTDRKIIFLHFHIFKNAGSTIDYILEKNFKSQHKYIEPSGSEFGVLQETIKCFLDKNKNVKSISSHSLRFPIIDFANYLFIEIISIRHPIDRIYSMFTYYQKINFLNVDKKIISDSFPDFVYKIFRWTPYNVINPQTNILSNKANFFFPPSQYDLDKAIKIINKIKFLLTVDQFDKSLSVSQYFLQHTIGPFDIKYEIQNQSNQTNINLSDKLNKLKSLYPDEYALMEKFNSLDIELWKAANQEINRRASFVLN